MPRVGLTKAAVVDAAAELVDATGREVTLAELASHLGIRAPSLYNHVEGQEGLRRELALRSLREMGRRVGRAAAGRAGDEAVTAVAEIRAAGGEAFRVHSGKLAQRITTLEPLRDDDVVIVPRMVGG